MHQIKEDTLAISFVCPTTIDIGDPVVISDDLTVAAIAGTAEDGLVGNVVQHEADAAVCTVSTRFRARRDDRVADETDAPPVGPFVYAADGDVIEYVEASHDHLPAGLIISKPPALAIEGTVQELFTITGSSNDGFSIKVGGGASQPITLAAGADKTAAQIATDINGKTTDITCSATDDGRLVITADAAYNDLEIETVANDCYSTLGLTIAVNHCSLVVETLEY
jgi:hypothetical protein